MYWGARHKYNNCILAINHYTRQHGSALEGEIDYNARINMYGDEFNNLKVLEFLDSSEEESSIWSGEDTMGQRLAKIKSSLSSRQTGRHAHHKKDVEEYTKCVQATMTRRMGVRPKSGSNSNELMRLADKYTDYQ